MAGAANKPEELLFVDGYNIINSWPDLVKLIELGMDAARDELITRMSDFCGYMDYPVIVVFDAHMNNQAEHAEQFGRLEVIYTAPGITADQYIERRVALLKDKRVKIRVASSDALVQGTIMAYGALRISAREFLAEVEQCRKKAMNDQTARREVKEHLLHDRLDPKLRQKLEEIRRQGRG